MVSAIPSLPEAVRRLYPFQGHVAEVSGQSMHYLDEGRGDPVLMLHGNPTWSFYYRGLVKALRGSHRVVVPDHIGCGLSAKPDDDAYSFTLEQRVGDVEELTSQLGLMRDITLIAHDWGGMIGMAYAVRHPERIKRLVLANTAAFPLPKTKTMPWQLRLCRTPGVGSVLVRGLNAFSRGAVHTCVTRRPLSGAVRAGYLAPYDSWSARRAVLRFVEDIPLAPADPSYAVVEATAKGLAKLGDVPMLLLWGAKDFVFDDHFLAEWVHRFPKAEVHRFADAGHYVLEDAAEEVEALVRAFVERT
jgi:haloalkane dehalogenase